MTELRFLINDGESCSALCGLQFYSDVVATCCVRSTARHSFRRRATRQYLAILPHGYRLRHPFQPLPGLRIRQGFVGEGCSIPLVPLVPRPDNHLLDIEGSEIASSTGGPYGKEGNAVLVCEMQPIAPVGLPPGLSERVTGWGAKVHPPVM